MKTKRKRHSRGRKKSVHFGEVRQAQHALEWHNLKLERGVWFGEDEIGLWATWGVPNTYLRIYTLNGDKVEYQPGPCDARSLFMWRFKDGHWVCAPERTLSSRKVAKRMAESTPEERLSWYHVCDKNGRLKGYPSADPFQIMEARKKTQSIRAQEKAVQASYDDMYASAEDYVRFMRIAGSVLRNEERRGEMAVHAKVVLGIN